MADPTDPLLLRGARLGPAASPADVLLADGAVAAAGDAALRHPARARARVVDLDGRWLLPGLWDEHVHLTQWALARARLDVSGAASAAQAAALVRERCAADPAADPATDVLVGAGFRDGLWPDAPTPAALDAAGAGRPVVLLSADLHCAWLSTSAAALLGASPGPDGLVREEAAFALTSRLSDVPDAVADARVADAVRAAAARGVVGVVDLEMSWALGAWERRASAADGAAGGSPAAAVRVEAGVYPADLDRALAEGRRTGQVVAGTGGLVRVGPLKVIADGSLNTRTACCEQPYPDGSHGVLTLEPAALAALLRRAVAGGLLPAVHAIGDRAVREALDAIAAAGAPAGARVEHAQLVAQEDLPRFAALGVTASVQPEHALDDRDVAERHWAGRTHRAFPLRSLLDAGARLALGSDAPVAPLDPWRALAAAVTRTRDGRPPWHPEQRIGVDDALAASARGRRRVAAGDPADLVAVDADPWAAGAAGDGDRLRATGVDLTLLAGRATHDPGRLTG